ncbi:MAG: hypothetical protein DK841_05145 [Candidatus Melainabacteria bacterium]|nr:MAG: hypothetical protein DK841_05145 [Candidatus Melainabacteria bacterium]
MKKILVSLAILVAMIGGISTAQAQEVNSIEVLPTMNTQSTAQNRIWVGTFQLVWNELTDKIVKAPVKFLDFDSQMANNLNQKQFKKSNLNEKSYYVKSGIVSPALKAEIEKNIKSKFHETSDILKMFDFTYNPEKIFVYAMLKKDFRFTNAFDKLATGNFGNSQEKVKYFGINDNSNPKLYKNVNVLFYNDDNDFAVKLYTKGKDEVLLYRTNDDKTFDKYYAELNDKTAKYSGDKNFVKNDTLTIPDIKLYQETSFNELEGHQIVGTNMQIDKTIETVDFRMNNKGVKLKSEAAIMLRCMSLAPREGRDFTFNNNFVLFLIEKNQNTPYYAMKVSDVAAINKTGK